MDWEKVKLGLWGAAGGAVVLAIVGFSWVWVGYRNHCSGNGCGRR